MRQKIVRSLAALLLAVGCDGGPTGPGARPVAHVEIAPDSAGLEVAGSLQLEATLTDRSGEELSGRTVYWSSADSTIARVSSGGLVTGVVPGKVRIAASAEGVSSIATVTVELPAVASVSVLPDRVTVLVGDTAQITAVPHDRADRPLTGRTVTWKSENTTVATVDASGRVVGRAPGTTRVVATSEGKSAAASFTVLPQPVATVSVSPPSLTLKIGESSELAASAKAEDGTVLTGRTVAWSTSDAKIAAVDAGGNVTGVAAGTAKVTATVEGKSASATVTVESVPGGPPPPPPPASVATVTVSPEAVALAVGDEQKMTATARTADDSVLTGRPVSWSSSDEDVASIGADGVVKALSAGTATITATVEGKSGTATVTVSSVPVASVQVSPPMATVLVGASTDLSAVAKSASGEVLTGRAVTWSSDDESIATVDASGKVTGVAAGSATVTATVEGKSATAEITVSEVPAATVAVSPETVGLTVGDEQKLTATVKDEDGNELTGRVVTWSTSDVEVATVGTSSGVVTGVAPGTAKITATVEGKSASATVTVTPVPVAAVTVSPSSVNLTVGSTRKLMATAKDADGRSLPGRHVTWTSSNPLVASVGRSNGTVRALLPGSATITATVEGKTGTAKVTVKLVPVGKVEVTPATKTLIVGESATLAAVARSAGGAVLTGRPVTWRSSDASVASVDGSGKVTAKAPGDATITATVEGKTGTAAITVQPVPVSTVEVAPPTASLTVGDEQKMTATAKAKDGSVLTGRTVSWSSSDEDVASIGTDGVVKALSAGTAKITATVEGKSATATVTVVPVPVATVEVSPPTATVLVGESTKLDAVAKSASGEVLTGRTVDWSTSDEAVATVAADGRVTAVGAGTATITAEVEGERASATVTVIPVPVASVEVTPTTADLMVGESTTFTAVARSATGKELTDREIAWSSSDASVASVDGSGKVAALAAGDATITATVEGKFATATVTVVPVPVATVEVEPPTLNLFVGDEQTMTATAKAEDGTVLTDRPVSWSSSDEAVATIGADGVLRALAPGNATITAEVEGKIGTATVSVAPVPVSTVEVAPTSAYVQLGSGVQLTATPRAADGTALDGRAVTWSSSDESVATVSGDGRVTGVAKGTVTITATSEGKSGGATVTVTGIPEDLDIVSGNGQKGENNEPLLSPLVVQVLDVDDLPVEGVVVAWVPDNGFLTPSTSVTDVDGRASSVWTLGGGPPWEERHARAVVEGLPPAEFTAWKK
jgi:uncharacterized protein YjdB